MGDEVPQNQGWTLQSYIVHNEALRKAEEKFQAERDRRYTEVAIERQKALNIKEEENEKARGLARQAQLYRDEQANKLREQISSERGQYATKEDLRTLEDKMEALLKPVASFVSTQQGRSTGLASTFTYVLAMFAALGTLAGIIGTIAAIVVIFVKGSQ